MKVLFKLLDCEVLSSNGLLEIQFERLVLFIGHFCDIEVQQQRTRVDFDLDGENVFA